jgi:hypothetical protein
MRVNVLTRQDAAPTSRQMWIRAPEIRGRNDWVSWIALPI